MSCRCQPLVRSTLTDVVNASRYRPHQEECASSLPPRNRAMILVYSHLYMSSPLRKRAVLTCFRQLFVLLGTCGRLSTEHDKDTCGYTGGGERGDRGEGKSINWVACSALAVAFSE